MLKKICTFFLLTWLFLTALGNSPTNIPHSICAIDKTEGRTEKNKNKKKKKIQMVTENDY